MVADTTDCLKVECSGTSMVTSNLGKTYSATRNDLWNTWSSTLTVMFQSPSTGDLDNSNSDEKTPRVVNALLQCFTRLPLPSYMYRKTIDKLESNITFVGKNKIYIKSKSKKLNFYFFQ